MIEHNHQLRQFCLTPTVTENGRSSVGKKFRRYRYPIGELRFSTARPTTRPKTNFIADSSDFVRL